MWFIEDCSTQTQYALYCGKWVIGRGTTSSIKVTVSAVSRQHVCLEVDSSFDPTNIESITSLTISDMNTKHGTKWKEEPLSTVTLTSKDDTGILSLSKSCSFKIFWKPVTFCFSRIASSQKKIYQSKLKQLGCHYISNYLPTKTNYLIVSDSFDVTPKLLQALIECIPIVTTSYIQEIEKSISTLSFPSHLTYSSSYLLISHSPHQDSSHIDISPQPFRKTVLSGYTFLFTDDDSPYIDIISLAGGQVDSAPRQNKQTNTPFSNRIVVYREASNSAFSSSVESLTIAMTRILPPHVLKWVQNGYIPFEEQELMHSLLIEGEFKSFVRLNTNRCAKEMELLQNQTQNTIDSNSNSNELSDETASESEEEVRVIQSPMKVMAVKRPELPQSNDDLIVEDFFDLLENQKSTPIQTEQPFEFDHEEESKPVEMPVKKRKIEESEEKEESEENEKWVGESILQEESSQEKKSKGKKFVKNRVKRSTHVIQLHPYQPSFHVCFNIQNKR